MNYKVIITDKHKEGVDEQFCNELEFEYEDLEEAEEFACLILEISDYSVEIVKINKEF